MPIDDFFRSKPKAKLKLNRYGKQPPSESVEMQLGRSDFLLGSIQSQNPFPNMNQSHSDAQEWTRGWLAEKSVEVNDQLRAAQKHLRKRR